MGIVKIIESRPVLYENGSKFKLICPFHIISEDLKTLLIDPDTEM